MGGCHMAWRTSRRSLRTTLHGWFIWLTWWCRTVVSKASKPNTHIKEMCPLTIQSFLANHLAFVLASLLGKTTVNCDRDEWVNRSSVSPLGSK